MARYLYAALCHRRVIKLFYRSQSCNAIHKVEMGETILVAGTEHAIREMSALNSEGAGYRVLRASNAEQAFNSVHASLPDLLLLDWSLPGMSAMELTRRLRAIQRTRNVLIILLSASSGELDKIAGLDSGADDYVTMPFSPRELCARMKALLRLLAPHTSDKPVVADGVQLDPVTHRVSVNGKSLELALTEFRLLHFLMKHPGSVHARARILALVWGDNALVEERTVDVSIRRLRKKLQEFDRQCMIDTVRGEGYRFSAANGVQHRART
jgi:two-component system, OmpR family, phosphate regulon response regulator PhoB